MWNEVGPQPVQISEIDAYLRFIGVTNPEDKQKYLRFIGMLDHVELNYQYEKRKKEAEKAKTR